MKRIPAALLTLIFFTSCGGGDDGPAPTPTPGTTGNLAIRVNWSPNREVAVNRAGGGYRVYYSATPGFSVDGAASVDVPYVSGTAAPTTARITGLAAGTYYIQVVAYSSLVGPSGGTESASQPSDQISVTVSQP